MSLRRHLLVWTLAGGLVSTAGAQAAPRPQPYCIRGVALDRAGERKGTLILRDGAIAAILDEAAPAPPGTRVIEGQGLICLPAFLDAFSRHGCKVPQPLKDQDVAPNVQSDAGIDMRLANRKGIQPGFRAVEAMEVTREQAEAWRKNGFGAALVAPGGELLSGTSALVTTRDAAMRDLVLRDEVFAHGAFAASGPGYPSTLMGYFAQLRQFLLDAQRQIELQQRYAQGRPGPRPPFDAQLGAGAALISGGRPLLCEASSSDDIERWLRLAHEFGIQIGVVGALEAWRVRDLLAERDVTVVLTLDWGKEVKDPRPKDEESKEGEESEGKGEAPDHTAPKEGDEASASDEDQPLSEEEKAWEYEEPYAVRLERRVKWEQGRDCALLLQDAGVRFVFGTASGKPDELLDHVRDLIVAGLPAEAALAALTSAAAEFLGVEQRLGALVPGQDATLTLWRADPLLDEDAAPAWLFVDGFPSEFKEEKKGKGKKKSDSPGEGVDPSGTWQLEFVVDGEGIKGAKLVIDMEADGSVSGSIEVDSPMGGARIEASIEGHVAGDELELDCTLAFGEFEIETTLTATLEGDKLEGDGSFRGPWSEEPTTQAFTGKRLPE